MRGQKATCLHCGETFRKRQARSRFCRPTCGDLYRREHETRRCSENGCERKVFSAGKCQRCYDGMRRAAIKAGTWVLTW